MIDIEALKDLINGIKEGNAVFSINTVKKIPEGYFVEGHIELKKRTSEAHFDMKIDEQCNLIKDEEDPYISLEALRPLFEKTEEFVKSERVRIISGFYREE